MSKLSPERLEGYLVCLGVPPSCVGCPFYVSGREAGECGQPDSREMADAIKTHIDALTTEAAEKDATIARLTKPDTHTCLTCVHWGTSMSAYPCLECGQHYYRSDLWEPAEGGCDE